MGVTHISPYAPTNPSFGPMQAGPCPCEHAAGQVLASFSAAIRRNSLFSAERLMRRTYVEALNVPTAPNSASIDSRGMFLTMNTMRERRSAPYQRSSFSGGWKMCCTPWMTTGPASPSTLMMPFTRKRSGPRSAVRTCSDADSVSQVNGASNHRQNEWIAASWVPVLRGMRCPR